jgi:hypothetical protein
MFVKVAFLKAKYSGFGGHLVSLFTNSDLVHVEFGFSDGICYSTSPKLKKVVKRKLYLDPEKYEIITIICSDEKEARIRADAELLLNIPYDIDNIVARVLFFWRGKSDKLDCVELAETLLWIHGYIRLLKSKLRPHELYNLLWESHYEFLYSG